MAPVPLQPGPADDAKARFGPAVPRLDARSRRRQYARVQSKTTSGHEHAERQLPRRPDLPAKQERQKPGEQQGRQAHRAKLKLAGLRPRRARASNREGHHERPRVPTTRRLLIRTLRVGIAVMVKVLERVSPSVRLGDRASRGTDRLRPPRRTTAQRSGPRSAAVGFFL